MKKTNLFIIFSTFLLSVLKGQDIASDLVGHWSFNGNAIDISGNGNNGSVVGASLTMDKDGNENSAYLFDGDDYIKIDGNYNYSFGTSGSIFLWMRLDGGYSNSPQILNFESSQYGRAVVYLPNNLNGLIRTGFRDDTQTVRLINTTTTMSDGEWHLIGFTYDGSTGRVYVDGVEDASYNATFTITDFGTSGFIGVHPVLSNFFQGAIDDVRLYNRALTATDVMALYNAPLVENNSTDSTGGYWTKNGAFLHYNGGNVGIGTTSPQAKLAVNGQIRATEVKVLADINIPDYVFEEDYELRTLEETEQYIRANKHLPEIPSASEIKENGINLGEMDAKLLQKIEELTLYLIEQNKELKAQRDEIEALKAMNRKLMQKLPE